MGQMIKKGFMYPPKSPYREGMECLLINSTLASAFDCVSTICSHMEKAYSIYDNMDGQNTGFQFSKVLMSS